MERPLPTPPDLLRLLALGASLGLVVLGVGGRLAMRALALLSGAPATSSVGGTVTVVLAGAASGVGGVLFFLLARALRLRLRPESRWAEPLLFGALLLAVTLRGLRPVQLSALAAFLPLVLVYAAALSRLAPRVLDRTAGGRPGARE